MLSTLNSGCSWARHFSLVYGYKGQSHLDFQQRTTQQREKKRPAQSSYKLTLNPEM